MVIRLADAEVENVLTRRVFVWSGAGAAAGFALGMNNAALADVKLTLSNIEAAPVPCPSKCYCSNLEASSTCNREYSVCDSK